MSEIVTGLFTIIGVIIGNIVGYNIAVSISDRKEFHREAMIFYNSFVDTIISLDQKYRCRVEPTTNTYEILNKNFPRHMKAMLRFRLHLDRDQRELFDKAWREYCHYDISDEPEYPFLEQYHGEKWDGQCTRELALKRIEQLLSFTRQEAKHVTYHIEV